MTNPFRNPCPETTADSNQCGLSLGHAGLHITVTPTGQCVEWATTELQVIRESLRAAWQKIDKAMDALDRLEAAQ